MEFIAFKRIKRDGEKYFSPSKNTEWQYSLTPAGVRLYQRADVLPESDNTSGIYAATREECRYYSGDLYLVSPEPPFVLGEAGWRAAGAYVVAGPLSSDDMIKAYETIVSYALNGYRQVKEVLLMACQKLIGAGRLDVTSILQICGTDAGVLYYAARYLPNERFDPALIEALIETGDAEYLCKAAINLPGRRFDPALVEALIDSGDAKLLYHAARLLPDERFDPALIEALIDSSNAEYLYNAARFLSDRRFDPALIEALIDSGDAEYLYRAAVNLPDGRFDPALVGALIETDNTNWIHCATVGLPADRFDYISIYQQGDTNATLSKNR